MLHRYKNCEINKNLHNLIYTAQQISVTQFCPGAERELTTRTHFFMNEDILYYLSSLFFLLRSALAY
jgi:hypothetical protein